MSTGLTFSDCASFHSWEGVGRHCSWALRCFPERPAEELAHNLLNKGWCVSKCQCVVMLQASSQEGSQSDHQTAFLSSLQKASCMFALCANISPHYQGFCSVCVSKDLFEVWPCPTPPLCSHFMHTCAPTALCPYTQHLMSAYHL